MKKIGRNGPCPCGSGKKFKKCCLQKGVKAGYTLGERESALAKINSYVAHELGADDDGGLTSSGENSQTTRTTSMSICKR